MVLRIEIRIKNDLFFPLCFRGEAKVAAVGVGKMAVIEKSTFHGDFRDFVVSR